MKCPKCGRENDDNYPLDVDGKIVEGGCVECWENESDREWWKTVIKLDEIIHFEEQD